MNPPYPVLNELDEAFKMLSMAHDVYLKCQCLVCAQPLRNRETECKAWNVQQYLERHHERLKCEADGKRLEAIRADKAPKQTAELAITDKLKRAAAALVAIWPAHRDCNCRACSHQKPEECPLMFAETIIENHVDLLKRELEGERLDKTREEKTPFNPVPRLPIQCPEEFREELRGLIPEIMRLMGCGFESSHLNDALISMKNEHTRSHSVEAHGEWEEATKACENDS